MHAELTNGTIIELVQDCQCLTHTGPHWLHMDEFTQAKNREMLARATSVSEQKLNATRAIQVHALLDHLARVEIVRLDGKFREITRRGIKRIIRPSQPREATPGIETAEPERPGRLQEPETPEAPYQRRADGHPLYYSADGTWEPMAQYALDHYGLIPEAKDGLFQDGRPDFDWWAKPSRVAGWAHSATFNRWTALVEFPNGHNVWTWPKTF